MPAANTVQVILQVEGISDCLNPYGLSGVSEEIISGKNKLGRIQPHYW